MPYDDGIAGDVAIATNLSSTAVAFVDRTGRVRLRRPPDPGSDDLGCIALHYRLTGDPVAGDDSILVSNP